MRKEEYFHCMYLHTIKFSMTRRKELGFFSFCGVSESLRFLSREKGRGFIGEYKNRLMGFSVDINDDEENGKDKLLASFYTLFSYAYSSMHFVRS